MKTTLNRFAALLWPYLHRVSLRTRKRIEKLPVKEILGVNLASLAFAMAIVAPSSSEAVGALAVAQATSETTITTVLATKETAQWPLPAYALSQGFHFGHPGIDLTAAYGTPIYAITDGVVVQIAVIPWGYGKHVLVRHNDRLQSLYAHMDTITVKEGQPVDRTTQLGTVGATGWATGNHLHMEIYQDGLPVNPLEVMPEVK